jgi:ribonuclease III
VARIPLLDKRIAYQFKSGALREQALTHRSFGSPHNERLEFLGDGVLNCVVAEELYNRFPSLSEGQLSRLRANLVRKDSLSAIAQGLGLSEFLRLGEGEVASGGGSRPSMLADALEAVYGAVLLDGGYDAVRDSIRHTFKAEFEMLDPAKPAKDPKTLLQEHLQARQRKLPSYRVVATNGAAHRQTFEVECVVEEMNLTASGTGATRRIAEQNAAGKILKQIGQ